MGKKGTPHRKWSKEEKLRLIRLHLDEHISIREIERKYGVGHSLVSAWVKRYLEDGELVCIFPEGKLTIDGEIGEFKAGVTRILERTPVPVIPMAMAVCRFSCTVRAMASAHSGE